MANLKEYRVHSYWRNVCRGSFGPFRDRREAERCVTNLSARSDVDEVKLAEDDVDEDQG